MLICLVSMNTTKFPTPVVPIGAATILNSLSQNGFNVEFFDLCFTSPEELLNSIEQTSYEVICLSIRNLDNESMANSQTFLPAYKELLEKIRKISSAKIILGGAGFNQMPKLVFDYLQPDLGFYGEGEEKISDIVEGCNDIERLKELSYIFTPHDDIGKIYQFYKSNDGFNSILPDRSSYSSEYFSQKFGLQPSEAVQTRRGCIFGCSYCKTPQVEGSQLRFKKIDHVIRELHQLKSIGRNSFFFVDNVFNFPFDYAMQLCQKMIESNLAMNWMGYMIPQNFTIEFASLIKEAGCKSIQFGTDHLSDSMLKSLNKTYSFEDILQSDKNCKQVGLKQVHSILFGAFGETNETIRQCLERLLILQPDVLFISSGIRLYDETPLYHQISQTNSLPDCENYLFPQFYTSEKVNRSEAINDIENFIASAEKQQLNMKIINHF